MPRIFSRLSLSLLGRKWF